MTSFFVVDRVLANWAAWWPHDDLDRMQANVQDRIERAAEAWELTNLRPFAFGEVAAVFGADYGQRECVMKVNPLVLSQQEGFLLEAAALRFWTPTHATVPLLDERDDGLTLLMPWLRPGKNLFDERPDVRDVLHVAGALAQQLRAAGRPPDSMFERFVGSVREQKIRAALAGTDESALFDELLRTSPPQTLIHGDLHGRNIISHGDEWRAVDPKPCLADPNFEMHSLLYGPHLRLLTSNPRRQARRLVNTYADAAGLNPERVLNWARVETRANARWQETYRPTAAWTESLRTFSDALRP